MEDSYIIWLYVPDLSFKNRGSRKQFLSIQEFRENLAMHKALKKSLLEDEAAKQKESWWRNYGKRIDCKYQMNFLYLNIQIKITIQIVGIIVKDKHKNFYFKNDGHGPKLRSRHSPLALGTLVWSTWSEASSCSILWASETTGSTKVGVGGKECMRVPVAPHLSQHLMLSVFQDIGHSNRCAWMIQQILLMLRHYAMILNCHWQHYQNLTGRNRALSLWSGSTDSKTLDYQRINSREY